MVERIEAKVSTTEFQMPVRQSKGHFTHKGVEDVVQSIRTYLKTIGWPVIGNMEGADPSRKLGPFHEVYHIVRDTGYTVCISRTLGSFVTEGRGEEMEPVYRTGPDAVMMVVYSPSEAQSHALLEEILYKGQDYLTSTPVISPN